MAFAAFAAFAGGAAVYYSSLGSIQNLFFSFKNTFVVFIGPLSLVLVVRIWRESGGVTKGFSAVAPFCLSANSSADGALFM